MDSLRRFRARLAGLFRRRNLEAEMAEEMRLHLERRIEEKIVDGLAPDDARYAAQREFGGVAQFQEQCRDERRFVWVEQVVQDVRYAARSLRKNPGFTGVVVLTLALGIGANTAIFSVVNAVLLRPLPYREPGQLVQLGRDQSGKVATLVSSATFLEIKAQSQALAGIAAYSGGDMTLSGAGPSERIVSAAVTADFFPLLGVQPSLGRNFTREEDTPHGPRAVILGHNFWQSRFGGDPAVLGRTVTLNQQSYTVVGVLPARFQYPEGFQLWIPLALGEAGATGITLLTDAGGMSFIKAVARLKSEVTLQQAQAEVRTIAQRMQSRGPAASRGRMAGGRGGGEGEDEGVLTLIGLHERLAGEVKGALLVLLGAVAFVLLIACANVANLLLARATARQREMAVRAALGAGRLRVARQLLTESVLLSLAGGSLGLLLAYWGVQALRQWNEARVAAMHGIGIDGWVLAFTLGVSVMTGVAFGLVPAVRAWRTDVNAALKGESRGDPGGHRNRLRQLLVVSEVALALVLLVGAGLLLKSFARLLDVNPGFRTEGVLTFQVALSGGKASPQQVAAVGQILERLKALPGVQAAAATDSLPLTHFSRVSAVDVEGRPRIDLSRAKPGDITPVSRPTVTVDYFSAMGIALKSGRAFTAHDVRPGAGVVMVNEAFEKKFFPGQSAIGKRIHFLMSRAEAPWPTVIGVVNDVRVSGLAADVIPEVYSPELADAGGAMSFVVRSAGAPDALIPAVRAVAAELGPNRPIYNVTTMEQRLAATTNSRRLNTALLGGFAALALLLAAVGIYGVMSYSVMQRRREIGVRMALGAQRGDVLGLVIRGGLRLALGGVVIGLIGALALTRYMASLLYAVKATDPLTFLSVAAALTAVAVLASWLPARRATKVDPMIALRCE